MKYSWGFSWKALLIVILPMIPNFFYFIFPNILASTNEHFILDSIEHVSQFIYIILLIFLISDKPILIDKSNPFILGMVFFLLLYFILWVFLFLGNTSFIILFCMAVFPIIYFILAECWLYNYIAMCFTIIFGITHIIVTFKDFL